MPGLKTHTSCFLIAAMAALGAYAQKLPDKGMPLLENHMPAAYHNKGKVWDIQSAGNGITYMAADQGLLEYDGTSWNAFRGSAGNTRSLLIRNDSVIYTGSDLDFGVWKRNKHLAFEYTSLYPFQQELAALNEEFWDIHQVDDYILFVSAQNIYIYSNDQFTKISAPSGFVGSYSVNDTIYFSDELSGLYVLENLSLKQVFPYPEGTRLHISGLYRSGQDLVVVSRDSGLYSYSGGRLSPLNNPLNQLLKNARVFSFGTIGNTHLAFGTVMRGLYITDRQGNIIHQVNKNKGLLNNTVLSLHYCSFGRLWIGMDFGVSALNLRDRHTYFYDYRGDFGTAYTALIHEDVFYLGTNQGLYQSYWDDLNNASDFHQFQLVRGTEGQVWALQKIDDSVFMGHDQGLFQLEGAAVEQLDMREGVWTVIPYRDYLLTGNYNGISIFRKENNQWNFIRKMELILGSCNQLVAENDSVLWVNIPNFGIIRAVLDEDLYPAERTIFTENQFEGRNLFLTREEEGMQVLTDRFQYRYNTANEGFERVSESTLPATVENILPGVYRPVPLDSAYGFFPVYNGFALNFHQDTHELGVDNLVLVLRGMEAFNHHHREPFFPGARIPYRLNSLRVDFLVPNQDHVAYQFAINGSADWSVWSPDPSLLLSGLRNGKYQVFIRAKVNDAVSEPLVLSFRINAPWYRSWYAYGVYLLLLVLSALLAYRWQKAILKKQKKAMLIREQRSLREQAEKHRHHILEIQQKQLQSEYDLLKQQMKNKTIELANKARDNEEKNRLLLILKEKCMKAEKLSTNTRAKWGDMQKLIDKQLSSEDKTFEIQMDELHQELFKKLRKRHADLSANDLRLCAYIKIGLNSKEIADLLNIQPSSTYISRSRLRKKLSLKPEEDLYEYLNSI